MSRSDRVKTRLERWASLNPGATEAELDRKTKRIAERLDAERLDEQETRRREEARRRAEAERAAKLIVGEKEEAT